MTDLIPSASAPHRHRKRKSFGALIALLVVLVGAIGLAAGPIQERLSGPADFTGAGTESVAVVVATGDTIARIGNALKAAGVVASVDAFTSAAAKDPAASGIQPGTYELPKGIPAKKALELLISGVAKVVIRVTIPEGKRAQWSIDELAKSTEVPANEISAALSAADFPTWVGSDLEGRVYPATYEFSPGVTAADIATAISSAFKQMVETTGIENGLPAENLDARQVLTVASLLEAEAHPNDFSKVARVIYNRLREPMRLQFDSTVNYGLGTYAPMLSQAQLDQDTPYNTYLHDGLPPGPIGSPGADAVSAALNAAAGNWLYFVTIDFDTDETKFTNSYQEFLGFKEELLSWCSANPGKC